MASSVLSGLLWALFAMLLLVPESALALRGKAYPVNVARFVLAQAALQGLLDVHTIGSISTATQCFVVLGVIVAIGANRWANRVIWGRDGILS